MKKKLEEEEKQILAIMGINMFTMEEMLSDRGEKQGVMRSALEINQPSRFLQVSKDFFFYSIKLLNRSYELKRINLIHVCFPAVVE